MVTGIGLRMSARSKLISLVALSGIVFATGCAVQSGGYRHSQYGTYDPSPSNNYSGKISYEPFADYLSYMISQCAPYGGLLLDSVKDTVTKAFANNFGFAKEYQCKGPPPAPRVVNVQPARVPENLPSDAESPKQQEKAMPAEKQPNLQQTPPASSMHSETAKRAVMSLGAAKAKCGELGFRTGTEAYGKCVMRLSR